jgi:hypothetical protein
LQLDAKFRREGERERGREGGGVRGEREGNQKKGGGEEVMMKSEKGKIISFFIKFLSPPPSPPLSLSSPLLPPPPFLPLSPFSFFLSPSLLLPSGRGGKEGEIEEEERERRE